MPRQQTGQAEVSVLLQIEVENQARQAFSEGTSAKSPNASGCVASWITLPLGCCVADA